ncbi:hypothetical protein SEMRO_3482_G348490.1 [Seminavis robusta]|uniref:Uncharacterized protein n=1 Tax=Seminavis robusta TaxID=568900 RepID=A0A9N8HXZ5_9STRA|nr:hypothetical protein SEMRO_3482_G348490.1 [Seminavis robusta]|eukprot:Sro3482_g348490.1 n/a (259) ;mRNA; r:5056-5832
MTSPNKENHGGINWSAIMQSDWEHDLKVIEQFGKGEFEVEPDVPLSQKHSVAAALKKEKEESDDEGEFEFGKEPAVEEGKGGKKELKPRTPTDYGFKVVRLTDLVPDGFPHYPNGSPSFPHGDDSPVYPNHPDVNEYAAADPTIRRTNSPHKPTVLDYKKKESEPLESRTCGYCFQAPCYMLQDMMGGSLLMTGDMMKDEGYDNNKIRKALYGEASRMINGRLGPGKRMKLPVCVEGEIKDCYPRNKNDPAYVGYKPN